MTRLSRRNSPVRSVDFAGAQAAELATTANSLALQRWLASAADRDSNPVNVLFIGDSITEGHAASTPAKRYWSRTRDQLRTALPAAGVTGGVGYISALNTAGMLWQQWTQSGPARTSATTGAQTYGLGRRCDPIPSTGSTSYTWTGTSCDLLFGRDTNGGVARIVIDGGTAYTYSCNGTTQGGNVWNSVTSGPGALTAGAHTVVVSWDVTSTAGQIVSLEGGMFYNGDETKGIRFWDASHFGFPTSGLNFFGTYSRSYQVTKADLVVIELGTNDFTNGLTSAQFKANILAVLFWLRNQLGSVQSTMPSVVLLMTPERQTGTGVATPVEPWGNYLAAAYAIAAADSQVAVMDLGKRLVSPVTTGTSGYGIYYDGVHPNDKGHAMVADALTRFLLPR